MKPERQIREVKKEIRERQVVRKDFFRTFKISFWKFFRGYIQDIGTTFYTKAAEVGKIAKELNEQSAKKGRLLKCYTPVHGTFGIPAMIHLLANQERAIRLLVISYNLI